MILQEQQLARFLPHLRGTEARDWAQALTDTFDVARITSASHLAHYLGQLHVESAGFRALVENLNYSADGLRRTWPSRFPTPESARAVARQPQAIANLVYNGRMGNRPGSDDGWHFRGRGLKQLTGRANYTDFERWLAARGTPAPIRTQPDLLTQPHHAALSAAWFWGSRDLSRVVDGAAARPMPEVVRLVTKIVNGGQNGLADRQRQTARAWEILQ